MTPFTVDVLCVGQAPYDLSFTVPHHPAPDEKTVADAFVACGGGPAANAAVQVARLGGRSALAAYLGLDGYGEQHRQELELAGVNTQLVVRGADPTTLSVVLVKPDGQRALVNYRGATRPLPAASIDFARCQARVILFDGLEPEISPPLAEQARQQQ
ncbi:MAG: carbohydrate kinase family protein, partial [Anaerolineales bacterium]|nr:carbohydrate kinase family protein [Anaerolineales bacterium]